MRNLQITQDDQIMASSSADFGFGRSNLLQLLLHFVLAVFVGFTLRLTTFAEATTIAAALGDQYSRKTSFLVSFGFTKAFSNVIVGRVSDLHGRQKPHVIGWLFGIILGVILLILLRSIENAGDIDVYSSWKVWYILANICLGAQQGWTWTTNIFMFMDIIGPKYKAFASALSNSVGYLSSGITTYAAAKLSTETSFRLVLATSIIGFIFSSLLLQDTTKFVEEEMVQITSYTQSSSEDDVSNSIDDWRDEEELEGMQENVGGSNLATRERVKKSSDVIDGGKSNFWSVVIVTCWKNKSTAVLCAGGLIANLMTSLAWGLVLIWGKATGLSNISLANIGAAFTFTKGIAMLLSGYLSDRRGNRKCVLIGGFAFSTLGLFVTASADVTTDLKVIYTRLLIGGIIIGCGIGSVYCVLTAALSDQTPPKDRASAIGVYKFWRDSGYAVGGLLTGFIVDASGGSFLLPTFAVAGIVVCLIVAIAMVYREANALFPKTNG